MTSKLTALAISLALVGSGVRAAEPPATAAPTAAQRYGNWGVDLAGMDHAEELVSGSMIEASPAR